MTVLPMVVFSAYRSYQHAGRIDEEAEELIEAAVKNHAEAKNMRELSRKLMC